MDNGSNLNMANKFEPDNRRNSVRLKPSPPLDHPVTFKYKINRNYKCTRRKRLCLMFKKYLITSLTTISILVSLCIGFLSKNKDTSNFELTKQQVFYLELPNTLLSRCLNIFICPLFVSNILLTLGSIRCKEGWIRFFKSYTKMILCINMLSFTLSITIAYLYLIQSKQSNTNLEQVNRLNISSLPECILIKPYVSRMNMITTPACDMLRSRNMIDKTYEESTQLNQQTLYHQMRMESLLYFKDNSRFNNSSIYKLDKVYDYETTILIGKLLQDNHELIENRFFNSTFSDDESTLKTNNISTFEVFLTNKSPINSPSLTALILLYNTVPQVSLFGQANEQIIAQYSYPKKVEITPTNIRSLNIEPSLLDWQIELNTYKIDTSNYLLLLTTSILLGISLSFIDELLSNPMLDFCASLSKVCSSISLVLLKISPIFAIPLMTSRLIQARKNGNPSVKFNDEFKLMANLMFATSGSLIIYTFIILPLIYLLLARRSPLALFRKIIEPTSAAFSTSSSCLVLAATVDCLEDVCHRSNIIVTRLVVTLGHVMCQNGNSMCQIIFAIFVAHQSSLGQQQLPLSSALKIGLSAYMTSLIQIGRPSTRIATVLMMNIDSLNVEPRKLCLICVVDFLITKMSAVADVVSISTLVTTVNAISDFNNIDLQPSKISQIEEGLNDSIPLTNTVKNSRDMLTTLDDTVNTTDISPEIKPKSKLGSSVGKIGSTNQLLRTTSAPTGGTKEKQIITVTITPPHYISKELETSKC